MKKFLLCTALFGAILTGCSSPAQEAAKAADLSEEEAEIYKKLDANFHDVRNDTTGNWLIGTANTSMMPEDYIEVFYKVNGENLQNGKIYWIVNFANNTTVSIQQLGDQVYITTRDYVEKEEHDAHRLGSGTTLEEKSIPVSDLDK